ncbi:MAG TPA: hypothetical protein PKV72_05105, partial [Candidatus Peribacteria bacterium]|nr:hypothetical protein [Candidatus Peribacteria bacterium]
MYPQKYKHTSRVVACLLLTLCAGNAVGYAQEAPTDEDFSTAKTHFEEVWKTAADNTRRQAELQTSIVQTQQNVEKAKTDLVSLTAARRDLRMQINEQRALIDALAAQRTQVALAKQRYHMLAQAERARIVAYVRFAAVQDLVVNETGPVAGGVITRHMLRSSLDNSIDVDLGAVAVAQARETLIGQLGRMSDATDAVQQRLQAVAQELDNGMRTLEAKEKQLGESM